MTDKPPQDNLVRAMPDGFALRHEDGDGETIFGHFARFNEWTEINSVVEGHFMERFAPGAFKDAIESSRNRFRMLFQHGRDPQIGDKPIAEITDVREDSEGVYYEGKLLDAGYVKDLIPGLRANQYGASMRFSVNSEDVVSHPKRSDSNPHGLPERTVTSANLLEFGPVTFPAYAGATAGVRSLTDEFTFERLTDADGDKLRQLAEFHKSITSNTTPVVAASEPAETASKPTPAPQGATPQKGHSKMDIDRFTSVETLSARRDEIVQRQEYLNQEWAGRAFDEATKQEWDDLKEERAAIDARVSHLREREDYLRTIAQPTETTPAPIERVTPAKPFNPVTGRGGLPENIYDLGAYRQEARSLEHADRLYTDGAKRAIEVATFPSEIVSREEAQTSAEKTLLTAQGGEDDEPESTRAKIARHMLVTGTDVYKRAVGKYMRHQDTAALSPEESKALFSARALSLTGANGGFAVPFELDPTIILTNAGTINAIRRISRVIQITVDEWRGVTTTGVTASYQAEATETTDDAPTLVQPTISTEKAQAFVPFSIEVGMDWDSLQAEMGRAFADAKDRLEASKFVSGTGTNEPFGVLTGTTNTVAAAAGQTFTLANLYALLNALPARFQDSAAFMGNLAVANRIRQFDTSGGAALWVTLGAGAPDQLLGLPWYQASDMADVATSVKFLLLGDFSRYVIVDRVGLSVDLIPHLFGTNHRPTGQRGLYAFWRNGAKVIDATAFRALLGTA